MSKFLESEIAWISKLNDKFTMNYKYPSNGKFVADSLDEAKKEVETTFKWFLNCVG